MILVLLVLAVLGLCLGSFVNALVWRVHEQVLGHKSKRLSILHGRSMCPKCKHELVAKDLVPLFSWLALRRRCRYCQKPISWQYPAVELVGGLVFGLSYIFWPVDLSAHGQWLLMGGWLVTAVGLLALAVYDFRWMLLPNRILYPALLAALVSRAGYILFFAADKSHELLTLVFSLAVASGVFLLIFIISQGSWIGFGDVRLGLITGTLLASPVKSFLMIFLASVFGTLFVLPSLLSGKQSANSRLPYGPFLILSTTVVLLFGDGLISWYKLHFI